jgi:hypothetical protein
MPKRTPGEHILQTKDVLFERLNAIELLAVTLARAEELKPAESAVGIDNNILRDLQAALIPRPFWPDKPIISNFGLWFSRLYLDSPYVTWSGPSMFGDLYRNFGIVGVPIGMLFLGFCLRILYECTIMRGISGPLVPMLYTFLLMTVNLEGGYSGFLLAGSRVLFSIAVLCVLLHFVGGRIKPKIKSAPIAAKYSSRSQAII